MQEHDYSPEHRNRKMSKAERGYAILFGMVNVVNGGLVALIGPASEELMATTGIDDAQLGDAVMLRGLAKLGGLLLFGCIEARNAKYDRAHPQGSQCIVGPWKAMQVALLLLLLSVLILSLSTSPGHVTAALIMQGVGYGMTDTGAVALANSHLSQKQLVQSALALSYCVGASLSPLFLAASLSAGVSLGTSLCMPMGIVATLLVGFILAKSPGDMEFDANSYDDAGAVQQTHSNRGLRLTITLCTIYFCLVGCEQGLGFAASIYAEQRFGRDNETASLISSLLWASMFIGRALCLCFAGSRISPWLMLIVSVLCCVIAALFSCPLYGESITGLWILCSAWTFFIAPIYPTGLALVSQEVGSKSTSLLVAIMLCGSAGEMIYPAFIGWFFEERMFEMFPVLFTVSSCTALIVFSPWMLYQKRCSCTRVSNSTADDGL